MQYNLSILHKLHGNVQSMRLKSYDNLTLFSTPLGIIDYNIHTMIYCEVSEQGWDTRKHYVLKI